MKVSLYGKVVADYFLGKKTIFSAHLWSYEARAYKQKIFDTVGDEKDDSPPRFLGESRQVIQHLHSINKILST